MDICRARLSLGVFSLLVTSCGGTDPVEVCKANLNWRAPSPTQVACKGADGCACSTALPCCVEVLDDTTSPWMLSDGRCGSEASCPGLVFKCDGPEDCDQGKVCCVALHKGGGASCTAAKDCIGQEKMVMCHKEEDCTRSGHHCQPGDKGSFFDGIAGSCRN